MGNFCWTCLVAPLSFIIPSIYIRTPIKVDGGVWQVLRPVGEKGNPGRGNSLCKGRTVQHNQEAASSRGDLSVERGPEVQCHICLLEDLSVTGITSPAWQGLHGASERPKALTKSAFLKNSHPAIDETASVRTLLTFKLPKQILHRVSKTLPKTGA